jgi:hypothetical protein
LRSNIQESLSNAHKVEHPVLCVLPVPWHLMYRSSPRNLFSIHTSHILGRQTAEHARGALDTTKAHPLVEDVRVRFVHPPLLFEALDCNLDAFHEVLVRIIHGFLFLSLIRPDRRLYLRSSHTISKIFAHIMRLEKIYISLFEACRFHHVLRHSWGVLKLRLREQRDRLNGRRSRARIVRDFIVLVEVWVERTWAA